MSGAKDPNKSDDASEEADGDDADTDADGWRLISLMELEARLMDLVE